MIEYRRMVWEWWLCLALGITGLTGAIKSYAADPAIMTLYLNNDTEVFAAIILLGAVLSCIVIYMIIRFWADIWNLKSSLLRQIAADEPIILEYLQAYMSGEELSWDDIFTTKVISPTTLEQLKAEIYRILSRHEDPIIPRYQYIKARSRGREFIQKMRRVVLR